MLRRRQWHPGSAAVSVLAAGLISALLLSGLSAPAGAQNRELRQMIERLQRDVTSLQRQVYQGGASPRARTVQPGTGATLEGGPIAARMELRLSALESELAQLTGTLEQQTHQIQRIADRMDKLVADVDFRLRALERSIDSGQATGPQETSEAPIPEQPLPPASEQAAAVPVPAAAVPAPASGTLGTLSGADLRAAGIAVPDQQPAQAVPAVAAPPPEPLPDVTLPEGSVKERYDFAYSLLLRRRFDEASAALTKFITQHGDHPLAGNAHYWLGETYFVRDRYQEAISAFLKGYEKFPQGQKASGNLLKLGISLARLGDNNEACAAFDQLAVQFPNPPASISRRVQRERSQIACP